MGRFTVYRADVESPRLARVMAKVPGVAVAGDDGAVRTTDDGTAPPTAPEGSGDDGRREKVPETDVVDAEKTSTVRTYGLLGLGVSMVVLGIATVGIWAYRRRKGDGDESETPLVGGAAGEAPAATTPSAVGSGRSATEPSTAETESLTPALSTARPAEPADDGTEPGGRAEGDRTDIEWTARDTAPAAPSAGEPNELTAGATESDAGEDESRPTGAVDAAPLLGAAFLALSGAVVKWLRTDADEA